MSSELDSDRQMTRRQRSCAIRRHAFCGSDSLKNSAAGSLAVLLSGSEVSRSTDAVDCRKQRPVREHFDRSSPAQARFHTILRTVIVLHWLCRCYRLTRRTRAASLRKLSNKLNRKLDEYPMHRTLLIFAFLCGDLRRGEWSPGRVYTAAAGRVPAAGPRRRSHTGVTSVKPWRSPPRIESPGTRSDQPPARGAHPSLRASPACV